MKTILGKCPRIHEISSGICVSLAACFMLFIFAPLEIYMSNPGEFWYKAPLLLKYCLPVFAAAFLASVLFFAFSRLWGGRVYAIFLAVYFAGFMGCYVQGNFLVGNLPSMDGAEIDWSLYRAERIQSAAVWICLLVFAALLLYFLHREKFYKVVSYTSVFLFLILGVTTVVVCVNGSKHEKTDYLVNTKANQFEMSAEGNFIILVLDAVDEECFRAVLLQHPEYQEAFRDFTYYSNTLGGYPATDPAIALLVSGEWYEAREPFDDYIQRVYSGSAFLESLEESGYQLNLYDDGLQLEKEAAEGKFSNMFFAEPAVSDPAMFIKRQLKMVGVKYAPYQLKQYCWFDAHKLLNNRDYRLDEELFSWDNAEFYEDIAGSEVIYSDSRQFKLIHLMGAHMPFLYDEDLNETDQSSYASSIAACMKVTAAYLEKLRGADVYDNSIILVLSDHGLDETKMTDDKRQHPILFVKGYQERHEMQFSDIPVSQEDLAEAYDKLLQGSMSDEIFPFEPGEERERRYLYYWCGCGEMEEYRHSGYAGDESGMTLVGTYPVPE